MPKYDYYKSLWIIKHYRGDKIIWGNAGFNSLTQEGEESLLESFFRNDASYTPANFFIRLCNSIPLVTDTLATIQKELPVVAGGYEPKLLERSVVGFPNKTLTSNGNYRLVSKEILFEAINTVIGPVTHAFMATSINNSGRLIAFRNLTLPRTVLIGDKLSIKIQIDLV